MNPMGEQNQPFFYHQASSTSARDCLTRIKMGIINQTLFSRADVAHHKTLILLKGHITIYKKTIQRMNGSAIPDLIDNFKCDRHVCLVDSLLGDILIYIVL